MTQVMQMPVQPGELAPDFSVPAVQHDRLIALADYKDKSPLLLGLFPGLYCPFCRRALAMMSATSEKLKQLGIESVAIVGTELENARLYFKFRPTHLTLGVDPQLRSHRSYGVPKPEPTPELQNAIADLRINPTGEFPEPVPLDTVMAALAARDGYQHTATDMQEFASNFTQLKGQFIIDRTGVVRWTNIECGKEGLSGLGKFPTHDELVTAARILTP